VLGLDAHDSTTPLLPEVLVLLGEVSVDSLDKLAELVLVLVLDVSDGYSGGSLLVNKSTKPGLGLHNAVGDTHLPAESGKPYDDLDGVDIVGDHYKLCFKRLDELSDVVDTELKHDRFLSGAGNTALLLILSLLLETGLLLSLILGAVLVEKLEKLSGSVLVKSLVELVEGGGHLQSLGEHTLLALETHVAGPLHVAGHVTGRLDAAKNSKQR